MPQSDSHIALLSRLSPIFTDWKRAAVDEWMNGHSADVRVTLSPYERHRFIYDRTMSRAETNTLPVESARVVGSDCLRWLCIEHGDLCVAVWFKKIDSKTHLTSNYPTPEAVKRWHGGLLPFEDRMAELYICGHTVIENVAGDEIKIDGVWFTQEGMAEEKRIITICHRVFSIAEGKRPVQPDPQQMFPLAPSVAAAPPTVRIKPRLKLARPVEETPRTGVDAVKRAAEAAKEAERLRQQEQRKIDPRGA